MMHANDKTKNSIGGGGGLFILTKKNYQMLYKRAITTLWVYPAQ